MPNVKAPVIKLVLRNHPVVPVILGPNITGSISNNESYGAVQGNHPHFSGVNSICVGKDNASWQGAVSRTFDLKFDASCSNSIYGNSTTVQPPALVLNYVIKY